MTIDVDADYFRKNWTKCSASHKSNEATMSDRTDKPADVHFAELQARIQRLHESFDAWCESVADTHTDVSRTSDHAEARALKTGT